MSISQLSLIYVIVNYYAYYNFSQCHIMNIYIFIYRIFIYRIRSNNILHVDMNKNI